MEKLNLTQEWDKVFPKSDKVDHKKVTFHNRYGITLAADSEQARFEKRKALNTQRTEDCAGNPERGRTEERAAA